MNRLTSIGSNSIYCFQPLLCQHNEIKGKNLTFLKRRRSLLSLKTGIFSLACVLIHGMSYAQACTGGSSYPITSNEHWTTVPSDYYGQTIEVYPGVTFIIDGITLSLVADAEITNGDYTSSTSAPSYLIVENGATLQGCSGVTWGGIFWKGVANVTGGYYTQYTYSGGSITGPSTTQCSVVISN